MRFNTNSIQRILVISLAVAVVIILCRVIWGSPLVTRVREGFASGSRALINSTTECPTGSTMYMYEGHAYCCSTTINPDADTLQKTCRVPHILTPGTPAPIFCSLGPSRGGVRNCLEERAGRLQAEGQQKCPANMPNFVKNRTQPLGFCCSSAGNSQMTECADPTASFCAVTDGSPFADPTSCQFLLAKQNAVCPTGYGITTVAGQGSLTGLSLIGCSNNSTVCYPPTILLTLKDAGADISALPVCSS